jgi:hypothetical protein
MRDPMDTILSCYAMKPNERASLWHSQYENIVKQFVKYLEMMLYFRQLVPDRLTNIRFEMLVAQTEPTLRQIISKAGLSWHSSTSDILTRKDSVYASNSGKYDGLSLGLILFTEMLSIAQLIKR